MAEERMDLDLTTHGGTHAEENSMADVERGGGTIWLEDDQRAMQGAEMRPVHTPSALELQSVRNLLRVTLTALRVESSVAPNQKVVCVDSNLLIRKGLLALAETGLTYAPVWSSKEMKFIATLTMSDFVDQLLRTGFPDNNPSSQLCDTATIAAWLEDRQRPRWLAIDPETSLYHALQIMREQSVDCVPVFCPTNNMIVQVVTPEKILRFLWEVLSIERLHAAGTEQGLENVNFLDWTVDGLGIGSFKDVPTVVGSTPLSDCLRLMSNRRLTSIPIVDQEGKIIELYTRHDVGELARANRDFNVDLAVQDAVVRYRPMGVRRQYCKRQDNLRVVLSLFECTGEERLYCVNDDEQLEGVVSLKDIFRLLLE